MIFVKGSQKLDFFIKKVTSRDPSPRKTFKSLLEINQPPTCLSLATPLAVNVSDDDDNLLGQAPSSKTSKGSDLKRAKDNEKECETDGEFFVNSSLEPLT